MRCPACQFAATESTPACVHCGFTLGSLDLALGMPPTLKPDITDLAQEFRSKERRRLQALLARLTRRFPQMRFVVVACRTPPKVTLPQYAFWLFNRGGIGSAVEKGAANRIIMLVMDAAAQRAACMIGYGLEPFVSEDCLKEALETMRPHFIEDEPAAGVEAFFNSMSMKLELIAKEALRAYGLQGQEFESLQHLEAPVAVAALAY